MRRKPKHDMGSVEGIVRQYERQRRVLGSGENLGYQSRGQKSPKKKRK